MIKLKEIADKLIICPNCGWSWKLSDGGDDPYTCHKCGYIIKENVKEYSKYKIYCDLDSVLTDFDKMFIKIADEDVKSGWEYINKFGKKRHSKLIKDKGLEFWTKMPWMPDGKKLWAYLKNSPYEVIILSSPLKDDILTSKKGKIIWCKNNLSPNIKVIIEHDKYKYSSHNRILIDDLEKNIIPWRKNGGIGILHISADDTIQKLKKLGI